MMRAHRLALVSAASALMFALGMPAGAATSTWPDISGIYWTNSYSAKIQPVGGGDLPSGADEELDPQATLERRDGARH